jgi:hypothetical protein
LTKISIELFEKIVRESSNYTDERTSNIQPLHPFESDRIHQRIIDASLDLFDNGHYAQATFEAYKYVDKLISRNCSPPLLFRFEDQRGAVIACG